MNCAVGTQFNAPNATKGVPVTGDWLMGTAGAVNNRWQTYGKLGAIMNPSPSELWVLIDEHPDTINDPNAGGRDAIDRRVRGVGGFSGQLS